MLNPRQGLSLVARLSLWLAVGGCSRSVDPEDLPDISGAWNYAETLTAERGAVACNMVGTLGFVQEGDPERHLLRHPGRHVPGRVRADPQWPGQCHQHRVPPGGVRLSRGVHQAQTGPDHRDHAVRQHGVDQQHPGRRGLQRLVRRAPRPINPLSRRPCRRAS
ncbi:MAG: hypothetical protein HYV20_08630 [Gemmatimonadetes bacterium]|nr:hypothetical protein [Gemmatimonadota bacterium]